MEKAYRILEKGQWKDITLVEDAQGNWLFRMGKRSLSLTPLLVKPPLYTFLLGNNEVLELEIHTEKNGDFPAVNLGHYPHRFHLVEPHRVALEEESAGGGKGGGTLVAPMPGKVVEVKVKVADTVTAGDGIIVVEAMKMQNELAAEITGTVREVKVAAGQTVEGGQVLVVIG